MDNQLQKNSIPERTLLKNLAVALTTGNEMRVALIDKVAVNMELRKYKTPDGGINYPAIFNIPISDRIPAMAERDLGGTINLVAVALKLAMESMNLKRPMTNSQIIDLAEAVVDGAGEGDKISMEDLMLFLQKLTRGEYPDLYEGIDHPKFFSRFNVFRDERWEAGKKIKEDKDLEFKSLGPTRQIESTNPLDIHLSEMSNKVQQLKDELKEQKNINKRLREDF